MMWATRVLLVGILAVAAISLISIAISFASTYLAALVVLCTVGKWVYSQIGSSDKRS